MERRTVLVAGMLAGPLGAAATALGDKQPGRSGAFSPETSQETASAEEASTEKSSAAKSSTEKASSKETPSDAGFEAHAVGDFLLLRWAEQLRIVHRRAPERVLWELASGPRAIVAEQARANVRAFGTPEGAYAISDSIAATYAHPRFERLSATPDQLVVTGSLLEGPHPLAFRLSFTAHSSATLGFELKTHAESAAVNRIRLQLSSDSNEGFFGLGEQLTDFDQKGKLLPILVQEHGVGRGRPVVTQLVDIFANGGGGGPRITEAPAPHFLSSRLRSLCLENSEYSEFDFRPADHLEIKVWSGTMTGRIFHGATPLDLIEAYTEYSGRMRALPGWVDKGVIVSLQGGTEAVRRKLDALRQADVPLAGVWLQDWTGVRTTSAGRQLWWDWYLDESHYPDWFQLVDELAKRDGARMLIYVNPFLSNAPGRDRRFKEAQAQGWLVQRTDGSPYLIRNTDFEAGLIDLRIPEARRWIKQVIKDELIGRAGASGWMADFGEAMPFDAPMVGDVETAAWHNLYSQNWAQVNREAIEEAGRGEDIVFFSRSGYTQSPRHSTLFWLGDQLQSWDAYDGIKTAVVGMLSGGVSGFSLLHSDTGGYVTLSLKLGHHKLPVVARSNELLQRWIELAAFTCVFRTHEGLDPEVSAQFDSDPANAAHLSRFARVFRGLAGYRRRLVADAAQRGYPVVRHPFLHYPSDPVTKRLRYQFMLGPDLMVAPVLDPKVDTIEVYFPRDSEWVDLWSGQPVEANGAWKKVPAPLSRPAVFLRAGASSTELILGGLRAEGAL